MSGPDTLRESVLCSLLVAACGVLALYLPFLFPVAAVVVPSFPALLTVRHSLWAGLAAVVAAGLLLSWPLGPAYAVFLVAQVGLPGLVLGLLFKNRADAWTGYWGALGGQFLFSGLAWSWLWAVTRQNLFSTASLKAALNSAVALYLKSGGSQAAAHALTAAGQTMVLLWPGIILVWLAGSMTLAYFWARFLLVRQGGTVAAVLPFGLWRLPWYGIWGLIAGLSVWLAGVQFGWPLARQAGANLLYVAAVVYLVMGLAVAAFYYRRLAGVRFLRAVLVVAVIVSWQVAVPLFMVAGVLDSVVGLRRQPGKN